MSRPDRIYFVESPRGPHSGPHFDLDEALADALATASVAGRAVRVIGVPVDFCETVQPPQRPTAAKDSLRRVRELAVEAERVLQGGRPGSLKFWCGATATYAAPGVLGAGMHVKCDRAPGHVGPHSGIASSGNYWQWP